jgi:hypothetical protein
VGKKGRHVKRLIILIFAMAIGLSLFAGSAIAADHANGRSEWPDGLPPHGHVMLVRAEIDNGNLYFNKCVDLAAGKTLRGTAHHESVHTGVPGGSPFAGGVLFQAGNWVIPTLGLAPFSGCDDFTSGMPVPFPG